MNLTKTQRRFLGRYVCVWCGMSMADSKCLNEDGGGKCTAEDMERKQRAYLANTDRCVKPVRLHD